jgi:hypothetical protein
MHLVRRFRHAYARDRGTDGLASDTHGYEFGCHYLPYFISNSDTNTNIIEYEYKTDISNSDSHLNTSSIYIIESYEYQFHLSMVL